MKLTFAAALLALPRGLIGVTYADAPAPRLTITGSFSSALHPPLRS